MKLTTLITAITWKVVAMTLLLVLLKLCKVVVWPWWVIASPLWGTWLVVAIAAFCVCCYMLLRRLEKVAG